MYVVKLEDPMPTGHPFPAGFFPRTVRYLEDAKTLQREVSTHGGKAVVERSKTTPKPVKRP